MNDRRKPPKVVKLSGLSDRLTQEMQERQTAIARIKSGVSQGDVLLVEARLESQSLGIASEWFEFGRKKQIHQFESFSQINGFIVAITACRGIYDSISASGSKSISKTVCETCLGSRFGISSRIGRWQVVDDSWANSKTHLGSLNSGQILNLGFGQHLTLPTNLIDPSSWVKVVASDFGVYGLLISDAIWRALGFEEHSDRLQHLLAKEVSNLLGSKFTCLLCERQVEDLSIDEESQSADQFSSYENSISRGSLLRIGPRLLCSGCRTKTYGRRFRSSKDSDISEALNRYKDYFGAIPDLNWVQKPLLAGFPEQMEEVQVLKNISEGAAILTSMPNFFSGSRSQVYLSNHPEVKNVNWWELLHQAGLVGKFKQTELGVQGEASDGHWCLSLLEWKFCNALSANGVEHSKEPRYGTANFTRADYQIGELLVEIAGLLNRDDYLRKLLAKLNYAKENRLRVLVFTPKQVEEFIKTRNISQETLLQMWRLDVSSGGFSSLAFQGEPS
jgi:hypothetical protein